jgi:hypothetical protein
VRVIGEIYERGVLILQRHIDFKYFRLGDSLLPM